MLGRSGGGSFVAVVAIALFVAACETKDPHKPGAAMQAADAGAVGSATLTPTATATATVAASAVPRKACRIVSGEGVGPSADATGWIVLDAKSSFSVRMSDTTRELRFEGPGKVKACGGEAAMVVEGTAIALPGAGEGPGSEQWVVTPCAAMRWATGVHRIEVRKDTCKIHDSASTAYLATLGDTKVREVRAGDGGAPDGGRFPAFGMAEDGWARVDAPRAFELTGWTSPKAIEDATRACVAEADVVRGYAEAARKGALSTGLDGGGAAHAIEVRRAARARCGIALARVAAGGDLPEPRGRIDHAIEGLFTF